MMIRAGSDEMIEYRGPVDPTSGAPLTNHIFAVIRLFDDRKDAHIRSVAPAASTTLAIEKVGQILVGDRLVIRQPDKTWFDGGLVQSVDTQAGTVGVQNALPEDAKAGTFVSVALGDAIGGGSPWEIGMTSFTPAGGAQAGRFDYGLRARIPATQPGIEAGMLVRVEIAIVFTLEVAISEVLRAYVRGGG